MNIGIIAEDDSDVHVVIELTRQLFGSRHIGCKKFVGHGCGKIRHKCRLWVQNLAEAGCEWIVVVQDLDGKNESALRAELARIVSYARVSCLSFILIPKQEIESWLLYDKRAIGMVFDRQNCDLKLPGDPESIEHPKEFLCKLVWRKFKKRYINTIHNERIAKGIDVRKLKRSRSFQYYPEFIEANQLQVKRRRNH